MSLEFTHIHKRLKDKKVPDQLGEEGILNLMQALGGEKEFYVKQWYSINDKGISSSHESGGSPCSPFWVKTKFYEYSAVHDVFPEITIATLGAYDPRITKDTKGVHHFSYDAGRPATITKKVKGDSERERARDKVIGQAYKKIHAHYAEFPRGTRANSEARINFDRMILGVDREMQNLFGEELHINRYNGEKGGGEIVDKLITEARRINPESSVVKLLEFGVVPIHPEFNFIPQDQPESAPLPHGVFLEFTLLDYRRFISKARDILPKEKMSSILNKLGRFALYRALDVAFDFLVAHGHTQQRFSQVEMTPDEAYKYGPEVQEALFHLFETIRKKFENKPEHFSQFFLVIMDKLRYDFASLNPRQIPDMLGRLREEIA